MAIQRFIPSKDSLRLYRSFIRAESGSNEDLLDSNAYLQTVQKQEMDIEAYLIDVFTIPISLFTNEDLNRDLWKV